MKRITLVIALIALTGCADMTPREKFWIGAGIAVVTAGAVAAYRADHRDGNSNNQQSVTASCVSKPTTSLCQVM